jgi:branched-chain amino acid transport system permease protein
MNGSAVHTAAQAGAASGAAGLVRRHWPWLLALAVALALPWLFFDWTKARHSGFVVLMLSQMGMMVIFALSYNMQMGQAGLLSFGHAVLFGLGGYCTAHALNAIKAGSFWLPVELVPLVGALGGLGFAIVFGYIATKQRATAFAMITLGIGELVTACALMFKTFFGGEGGVSTNRVVGTSLLGLHYGASIQVYYLIVAWTVIAVALMLLLTKTPLGRMANACRDNFERAQFVGYDPAMVRFFQFSLSGFFAGLGGALYALTYEIVTYDAVSGVLSANALLMTYIGGVGVFAGPILGAVLIVLLQSWVSLLSNSWLVYVGVLFILMVTFAPGGLAGLIVVHRPIWRSGRFGRLVVPYVRILVPGLLVAVGFVLLIELCSFLTIGAAQGKSFRLSGLTIDPTSIKPWAAGALILAVGALALWREGRRFHAVWTELMEEVKVEGGGA